MRRFAFLLVLAGAAACAAKGSTASGTSASANRRDRNVMDSTELRDPRFSTVFDAVSALHADWLLPRGGPQANRSPQLGVWIEGQMRVRGVDYLQTIRPVEIKALRRLSPTESLHAYSWPWGGLVIIPR